MECLRQPPPTVVAHSAMRPARHYQRCQARHCRSHGCGISAARTRGRQKRARSFAGAGGNRALQRGRQDAVISSVGEWALEKYQATTPQKGVQPHRRRCDKLGLDLPQLLHTPQDPRKQQAPAADSIRVLFDAEFQQCDRVGGDLRQDMADHSDQWYFPGNIPSRGRKRSSCMQRQQRVQFQLARRLAWVC